jgi:hypothetical protein
MRTHRASLIQETTYKGKIRSFGKDTGKPHDSSNRRNWQRNWRSGGKPKQGSISGGLHLSRPLWGLHGFEQLPSPCVAQTGRGTGTAEADVPGHPAHHRDSGPKEGHGQGCSGHDATLPNGYNDDVYMQELPEGVRATVNSIHLELMGTGTSGPQSAASGTRSSIPARQHPNQSDRVNMTGRTRDREPATGKGGKATSEPSAKKVLKFAANLLPNGESGDLLNA